MLIRRTEIEGLCPVDVRIEQSSITEVGPRLERASAEPVLDARGGALIPGLHDHHLHLFALAAAESSIRCGPPEVRDPRGLARALAGGPSGTWLRGIGYHESVAGDLDRHRLDAWVPDRPARIQHRSGALWILNSAAIEQLDLEHADHAGLELDPLGRVTGRIFRADAWLRERLGTVPPGLADVSRRLASYGVTGLTDTTASNGEPELQLFEKAASRQELLQRVVVMGQPGLPVTAHPRVVQGAVKVVLDENDLPSINALEQTIKEAHREDRGIAIHCVGRAELVMAAIAFRAAGCLERDRIEHASIAPPDVVELLRALPLTVVTQPNFVRERGDAYLVSVEPADRPWLYRCAGFLAASIPLAGGTDAPFGSPDPWAAMRAATDRRTERGEVLGPEERLTPEQALALFTSSAEAPGDPPRSIRPGAEADLCLLACPWAEARTRLSNDLVVATLRGGEIIWRQDPP